MILSAFSVPITISPSEFYRFFEPEVPSFLVSFGSFDVFNRNPGETFVSWLYNSNINVLLNYGYGPPVPG